MFYEFIRTGLHSYKLRFELTICKMLFYGQTGGLVMSIYQEGIVLNLIFIDFVRGFAVETNKHAN